jgi:hypothetical protein
MENESIQEKSSVPSTEEQKLVSDLFELLEEKNNPWRKDFESTIKECFDFKELRQWPEEDENILKSLDVPEICIDRIDRGLSTIKGIRLNTGSRKKIVKRESGDARVAELLDKTCDCVAYNGDFESVKDDAFDSLCDIGIGIIKVGYDPSVKDGEVWAEFCNIEDVKYGR